MTVGNFLLLRLARIYPLHLALLGVWLAVLLSTTLLVQEPTWADRYGPGALLSNVLLLNSIGLQSGDTWNYPAWSIGAELAAYMVFFWVAAGLRERFGWHHALAISAVGYSVLVWAGGPSLQRTFDLGMVRGTAGFFLGVAVYFLHETRAIRIGGTVKEVTAVAVFMVLLLQPPGSMVTELATMAAIAALVLVFACSDGVLSVALHHKVPMFLGRISYSIYMVHALLLTVVFRIGWNDFGLQMLTFSTGTGGQRVMLVTPWAPVITLLALCSIIGIAAVTHYVVEVPCRRALRRLARSRGTTQTMARAS